MSMSNTEKTVKEIRRNTRRKFSTEEKIRIVLDGLRGENSVAELCRQEGINPNRYYCWSKDFLEEVARQFPPIVISLLLTKRNRTTWDVFEKRALTPWQRLSCPPR